MKSIFKDFIKYVSLNVLGMIGLSCYIVADTFFISGSMGADGLTALNLAIPIFSFISGVGLMIGIGGATKYSIVTAQKDDRKANAVFTDSLLLGIIISVVISVLGLMLSTQISKMMGANEHSFEMTNTYLKTLFVFTPFFILNNILIAFIRNDNNPKLSMCAMLLGSFSNIILDYIFIFPLNMGMFGAAFATGLAPVISIILLTLHFKGRNKLKLVKSKLRFFAVKNIILLGISSFINEVSSGIVLIVFNFAILALEGNIGVAAYGIVANLSLVAVAVFTGIAQGIQPIISKYYGQNKLITVKTIMKYAVILSLFIAVLIYICIFSFSDFLIGIFNSENNMTLWGLAKNGFCIYFIGFIFAGINIISAAFLSACEKSEFALIVSLSRGFIFIVPLVVVMSFLYGMTGIWLSFVITEMLTFIISMLLLIKNPNTKCSGE